MLQRRSILAASLILGTVIISLGILIWANHLRQQRQQRENHFIAIHYLASEAASEGKTPGSNPLIDLLKLYQGSGSTLTKPFAQGLIYQPQSSSFILEEPAPQPVSLFRSDRLISTDQKWPRWETSGRYAKRNSAQKVPPQGFE